MHPTCSTLRPDGLQPIAVLRLVVLAIHRAQCAPSDGRFLVERGDLMLIEEQPAAGKGKRRDLRPLSFQESLELLVNALRECCHMTPHGTVAKLKLLQSLMPMIVRPAMLHHLEYWSRLLRLSRWHDR